MSFHKFQIKNLIEKSLKRFDESLYSSKVVNLLLGTLAQESEFGTYIRQLGNGPALGVFQMEPNTFFWLKDVYKEKYPILDTWTLDDLECNLYCQIVMCRLRYRVVKDPIPETLKGQAEYYKKWYNTYKGKATVEEYLQNYRKYVE